MSDVCVKGGSWGNTPKFCRSLSRYYIDSCLQYHNFGFRLFFYRVINSTSTMNRTPILSFPNILSNLRAVFKPDDTERKMALATTPLTQAQWSEIVERFPECGLSLNPSNFSGNDENPVESASYDDIVEYINLVNKLLEDEDSDYRCCLPTKEIWEEFAKAGRDCEYPTGNTISPELANYGNHYEGTTPVMSFPPNPWGLYDMAGNVFEFVTKELPNFSETDDLETRVKKLQEELTEVKKKLAEAGK